MLISPKGYTVFIEKEIYSDKRSGKTGEEIALEVGLEKQGQKVERRRQYGKNGVEAWQIGV